MQWTLQTESILIAVIPLILGAALAVGVWIARRRGEIRLAGRLGVLTAVGGLLPVLAYLGMAIVALAPGIPIEAALLRAQEAEFLSPLVVGILAVAALSIRGRRRPGEPAAGIARRTALTFVPARLIVTLTAVAVITVAVSMAAGLASSPDSAGRYVWFTIPAGAAVGGTTIYGWFFSLPALGLLLILLAATWAALALIAQPPLRGDRERELAVRRIRSRNTALVATAAIAFHLAAVLTSLAGTARLAVLVLDQTGVGVTVHTSFAALAPALYIGGAAISCLAVALCVSAALSAAPRRARPRRATGDAGAAARADTEADARAAS